MKDRTQEDFYTPVLPVLFLLVSISIGFLFHVMATQKGGEGMGNALCKL